MSMSPKQNNVAVTMTKMRARDVLRKRNENRSGLGERHLSPKGYEFFFISLVGSRW
jgi:hypothetical protein